MKAEEIAENHAGMDRYLNEVYEQGFKDGAQSQLQALKQRLDDYKAHPIVKRRNGEEFKLYGFISIEQAKRIITNLEDNGYGHINR